MIKTLTIDNFGGSMTLYANGDINSGKSFVTNVSGQNPYIKPGQLTWSQAAEQIDPNADVIQDLILAGKERTENGVLYVYAIGHTGRLYKIQVNDPTTYNPDYDNPVLLSTLISGSPTFTRGAFMDFFGATERIYIGHDKGVTRINFDGTSETAISGTWVQNVPRPIKQFVGKLYIGNGSNIAEIDSTATVTSSAKLSPGFPDNTQTRDIDISPDGNYLQMVVSRLPLYDITSSTQETTSTASSESYIFKWNGIDVGYTTFDSYPSFSLATNIMFQNHEYAFGSDQYGAALYSPEEKLLSLQEVQVPLPNSVASNGNLLTWISPLYFDGVLEADILYWGNIDFQVGYPGYWDVFFYNATAPETDIIATPFMLPVSNFGLGASSNNYTNNIFGSSKVYFSSFEISDSTSAYRLYKWNPSPSSSVPSGSPFVGAIYQTQTQLFSKKITIKEARIYGEPWVNGNSFLIDLIGSSGGAISGGSMTFTAGSNLTSGEDFAWYTPDCAPTYALGVAITNEGNTNHVINKIEIDYTIGGK